MSGETANQSLSVKATVPKKFCRKGVYTTASRSSRELITAQSIQRLLENPTLKRE
jgi:hypothetical protein